MISLITAVLQEAIAALDATICRATLFTPAGPAAWPPQKERMRMMRWVQNFGLRHARAGDEAVAVPGSMAINPR